MDISRCPAIATFAETVSVSSEFGLFARRPVKLSVLVTTVVTYKPIASVDRSDLDFLIPACNDTYEDLNRKLYIRGKLTKVDGTNLDNKNFTSVTNKFRNSVFSRCTIAPNGVTITQATDL